MTEVPFRMKTNSESRQDLAASGNMRWFPFLSLNPERSCMIYILVFLPGNVLVVDRACSYYHTVINVVFTRILMYCFLLNVGCLKVKIHKYAGRAVGNQDMLI